MKKNILAVMIGCYSVGGLASTEFDFSEVTNKELLNEIELRLQNGGPISQSAFVSFSCQYDYSIDYENLVIDTLNDSQESNTYYLHTDRANIENGVCERQVKPLQSRSVIEQKTVARLCFLEREDFTSSSYYTVYYQPVGIYPNGSISSVGSKVKFSDSISSYELALGEVDNCISQYGGFVN